MYPSSSVLQLMEFFQRAQRCMYSGSQKPSRELCSHVCYSMRTKWSKALKSSLTTHAVINQRALSSQLLLPFLMCADPHHSRKCQCKKQAKGKRSGHECNYWTYTQLHLCTIDMQCN